MRWSMRWNAGQIDGVPRSPGAWLMTVARRRAIDRLRRAASAASAKRRILDPSAAEDEEQTEMDVDSR